MKKPPATPLSASALDLSHPGIIEASAGTGKTYTVAQIYLALLRGEKFLNLSAAGAGTHAPEKPAGTPMRVREILVVTFTNLATAELRSRLQKNIRDAARDENLSPLARNALRLADAEFDEAAIMTIHGFCLRILKEFNLVPAATDEIQADLSDEILRFATRWRARKIASGNADFYSVPADKIKKVIEEMLRKPTLVPEKPPAVPEKLPATAEGENSKKSGKGKKSGKEKKEEEDEKDKVFTGNALFLAATEALSEWRNFRKNTASISHDETLSLLLDALKQDPALASKIAARFKVAIVDEFQDTDPIQWDIFRRIFLAGGNAFFCVGDPKQAIYEFRGGDIQTYRAARDEIKAASGGNVYRLRKNWRSEPAMIAAFNEIFFFDKKICTEINISGQTPVYVSVNISGLLDYSPVEFPQEKLASNDTFEDVPACLLKTLPDCSNKEISRRLISRNLVADIVDLVQNRGVPAGEIAILVSTNDEVNRYRKMLGARGIPTSATSHGNVYLEPLAKPLADVLDAMLFPQNTAAFRRALLSPFFAEGGIALLCESEGSEKIAAVRERFVEARARWSRNGFLVAFSELSRALSFSKNLAKNDAGTRASTDLSHLLELIHSAERAQNLSPEALVENYKLAVESAKGNEENEALQLRSDSDSDAVRILTMHKSKGLEFDIVFLPSLWTKSIINAEKSFAKIARGNGEITLSFDPENEKFLPAQIESAAATEACLFYVALTRAKRRVVLYHAIKKDASRGEWVSYQRQILRASGATPPPPPDKEKSAEGEKPNEEETPKTKQNLLPHWQILDDISAPLPEKSFPTRPKCSREKKSSGTPAPLSQEEAARRFATGDAAVAKMRAGTTGVFSFSSIIRASEAEDSALRENDDEAFAGTTDSAPSGNAASPAGETAPREAVAFPRRAYSDLPHGAEFGTITHSVFEKTNFATRENLPQLADFELKNLPGAQNFSSSENAQIRENFIALVEENLSFPLFESAGKAFRLADLAPADAIHEMEFHFPLRRSKNLFPELARVFKSWGGIYAETAARHWVSSESKIGVAGMMKGLIDLAFRANGKFYILDWKTNRITPPDTPLPERLSASSLREEIVKHGYALQWAIYAVALRKFLQESLGENYVHDRDFGGIVYLFVRWRAPFFDNKTLTSARLDELERLLFLPAD